MSKNSELTLKKLQEAVAGTAAAFRCRTEYQPAGGEGSAVFPPTYEGGKYATVGYRIEDAVKDEKGTGRKLADQVVLNSVQAEANHMEWALQDAWERGRLTLPVITVDFSGNELERDLRVTSLDAPHRIADAILRDSLLGGVPFRKSELGRRLDHVDNRNATTLFELCPTSLVFGMWDSTGPKGGLGAKFQRAIVSEIVGLGIQIGVRTESRIDPAAIKKESAVLYRNADPNGIPWTEYPDKAVDELDKKGKPTGKKLLYGKSKKKDVYHNPEDNSFPDAGRPSVANHGNVMPTIDEYGGVTMERAVQTTVLSLAALRRLRFPLKAGERSDFEIDRAAQTALAALGLCAAVLTRELGCDLRSRCQLFPIETIVWELLDKPGSEPERFEITGEQAITLFNDTIQEAKGKKLPWREEELILQPSPELVELVRRSQQLAASAEEAE